MINQNFLLFVDLRGSLGQNSVANVKQIFASANISLKNLKIIDLFTQPELAAEYGVKATPCFLVKKSGGGHKKIIGTMKDHSVLMDFINNLEK